MRGEYKINVFDLDWEPGTTSACAENTVTVYQMILVYRNYLRVRGEYLAFCETRTDSRELPPRARRIQEGREFDGVLG